jgi:hypothetical protein
VNKVVLLSQHQQRKGENVNNERTKARDLIMKALSKNPWSSIAEMAAHTGADAKTLSNQLYKMHMLGRVESKRQGRTSVWAIREDQPIALTPNVAAPRRINVMAGDYACPELRTDLPPARMAAFRMPSRMGDKLFYRDGRVEVV